MSSVTGIIKVYDGMRQERLIRTRYRIIEFNRERDGEAFSWSNLFLFRIDASREREKPRR